MGKYYSYLLKGFAALGLVILAAACQKSGGGSNNTNYANSCGAGYVYTQQLGCLPQGNCPAGSGSYNGQCVSGIQSNGLTNCGYYGQQYSNGYNNNYNYGSTYNNSQYCNQYGNQYGNYYQQQYPYYQQYYYGTPYNSGYYPYGTRGGAYFRFGYGW